MINIKPKTSCIILAFGMTLFSSSSYAQLYNLEIVKRTFTKDICVRSEHSVRNIPDALSDLLGKPLECTLRQYEKTEYGLDAEVTMEWKNVKLTIQYLPPETTIYEIETTDKSPLTHKWYMSMRDKMISDFFDMNWKTDEFLGPTGEHYISKNTGTNAQLWLERDNNKAISWLRFSYAL